MMSISVTLLLQFFSYFVFEFLFLVLPNLIVRSIDLLVWVSLLPLPQFARVRKRLASVRYSKWAVTPWAYEHYRSYQNTKITSTVATDFSRLEFFVPFEGAEVLIHQTTP
tara:strand:+ start:15 stop:344 length:330 start_codon:yes stop_codon:yes gene_type:complete